MTHFNRLVLPLAFTFTLALGGLALAKGTAHDHAAHEHGKQAKAAATKTTSPVQEPGDPYYLTYCPVTREPLGSMGDAVVHNYQGREIRFCCAG